MATINTLLEYLHLTHTLKEMSMDDEARLEIEDEIRKLDQQLQNLPQVIELDVI